MREKDGERRIERNGGKNKRKRKVVDFLHP